MSLSKLLSFARRYPLVPSMLTYSILYPSANVVQQKCFREKTKETGIDWKEVSRWVSKSSSPVLSSSLSGFGYMGDCFMPPLYTAGSNLQQGFSQRTHSVTWRPRCSWTRPASLLLVCPCSMWGSAYWRGRIRTECTWSGERSFRILGR